MAMADLILFSAGVILGGLASWFIAHRYYLKGSVDQKQQIERLTAALKPRNTLRDFELLLRESRWEKTFIGNDEVWICTADNTFQIRRGERSREFSERWTTVYPDPNAAAYPVYLAINNNVIKELSFISMDGGRIFVPMAEVGPATENEPQYFWNLNSLEVKVCRIIGKYYIYENLEGVARMSRLALVD